MEPSGGTCAPWPHLASTVGPCVHVVSPDIPGSDHQRKLQIRPRRERNKMSLSLSGPWAPYTLTHHVRFLSILLLEVL